MVCEKRGNSSPLQHLADKSETRQHGETELRRTDKRHTYSRPSRGRSERDGHGETADRRADRR